jgi:hypothetical protein
MNHDAFRMFRAMLIIALAWIGFGVGACVASVPLVSEGNTLTCAYDGERVFSGKMALEGEGLDLFLEYLGGTWYIYKNDHIQCVVQLREAA